MRPDMQPGPPAVAGEDTIHRRGLQRPPRTTNEHARRRGAPASNVPLTLRMNVAVNRAKQADRKQNCPPLLPLAGDLQGNGVLCDRAWVVGQSMQWKPAHLC